MIGAIHLRCETVWSEDLILGQVYEQVAVLCPS
jgi:hypothetical protein